MILSRVITKLGAMPSINTGVIERMFTADLAYLQEFYRRINEGGGSLGEGRLSELQLHVRGGAGGSDSGRGGIAVYPEERLHTELAFLAYYLHWPHEDLLNMEHRDRLRWAEEVSGINQRLNEA